MGEVTVVFCIVATLALGAWAIWMLRRPQPQFPQRQWYYSPKRGLHDSIQHAGWCADKSECEPTDAPY